MMVEERELLNYSMVYKGELDFVQLYKVVREWLLENGYGPDKWLETLHLQRDSGGAKEQWIYWRTEKTINSYFKYKLDVDYHTLGMKKVETIFNGKKIKVDKGEVEVFFKCVLVLDQSNQFEDNFILKNKWVRNKWVRRFYYPEIDKHEELLIIDTQRLQSVIKQYLDLKGFMHEYAGELFHPVKGFE